MSLQVLLESTLSGMGYELVQLVQGRGRLVQVFIDKPGGVSIDDCVSVSNQLTRLFTVENIDYERLEVSSPGLDRPLTKPGDYLRFAGEPVVVKLRVPMDNRRKLAGRLLGLEDSRVRLEMDGKEVAVDLANVDSARLKPVY
ncbi:MAG TPA: ribosome maturation factor RimP [Thiobacillaceae bacterium]|nr:ribosome maturation factor RimP [Thiobacillaceae bacterium]